MLPRPKVYRKRPQEPCGDRQVDSEHQRLASHQAATTGDSFNARTRWALHFPFNRWYTNLLGRCTCRPMWHSCFVSLPSFVKLSSRPNKRYAIMMSLAVFPCVHVVRFTTGSRFKPSKKETYLCVTAPSPPLVSARINTRPGALQEEHARH